MDKVGKRVKSLCDHRISIKLEGKFYRTIIRPVIFNGTEFWVVRKQHIHKLSEAEMRMLKWVSENTRKVRILNEVFHLKIGVALLVKRWERVAWGGLAMFRGEGLMP